MAESRYRIQFDLIIWTSIFGTVLKQKLIQFVLVLALLCNPMVALAVTVASVSDESSLATIEQMNHKAVKQSHAVNHDALSGDDCPMDDCPMDCSDENDCDMNVPCQPCLSLQFVSAMLFETCNFEFSQPLQIGSTLINSFIPSPPCLPELQPPDSFYLS